MKKINPLILIGVFISLVFISFIFLNNVQKENSELKEQYNDFKLLATEYKQYNEQYKKVDLIIKKIESIAQKSSIANFDIKHEKKIIKVTIPKKSDKSFDTFINKLFNEKINITKFEYKNNQFYFEVGIL